MVSVSKVEDIIKDYMANRVTDKDKIRTPDELCTLLQTTPEEFKSLEKDKEYKHNQLLITTRLQILSDIRSKVLKGVINHQSAKPVFDKYDYELIEEKETDKTFEEWLLGNRG